jgi:DNA-binding Lrp family transcriptional regulator
VQSDAVDEFDLKLLHLLQIAPRISWAAAADVLSLSPSAVAIRWRRLREEGLAWVTVHPNEARWDHAVGFVEVDCSPAYRAATVEQLCADPRVVSVDLCLWGRELMLTVLVPDLASLGAFALDEMTALPGVTGVRTRTVTEIHADGSDWRLEALDPTQRSRAAAAAPATSRRHGQSVTPSEEWPLIEALTHDARLPVAELARACHGNPATVRRHLEQLMASGLLSFRCDVAYQVLGWPITCSWLARASPAELAHIVTELTTLPQLRLCVSLIGDANLGFSVLASSVRDIARFEQVLAKRLPGLHLVESFLHIRSVKRMGWMLNPDGRCTSKVIVPTVFSP